MSPHVLCIIPARGGSKGVPRKNVRPLGGKPLIAHSISCAQRSEVITRTIVTTEDVEIAEVASSFGAEVPFMRPRALAEDMTPDLPVFQHALDWLRERQGYVPDLVVHMRPTGPIREPGTVDDAIRAMWLHPEADSVRSVSSPSETPYKMWRINEAGYMESLFGIEGVPEPYNMPRQSLPEIFRQIGYIDVIRPSVIMQQGLMSGEKIVPFIINEAYVEIDYEEDFQRAEALIATRSRAQEA